MTTWNSRIVLRHDNDFVIDETIGQTSIIMKGELAFAIDATGKISGRVGVQDSGMPFADCPEIFSGGALLFPLAVDVPSGSGIPNGSLLRWDSGTNRFVADVDPIEIGTNQTGTIAYDAAGDSWSIDTASFVPSVIDGGSFNDDYLPPSFTSTISIGEPTP